MAHLTYYRQVVLNLLTEETREEQISKMHVEDVVMKNVDTIVGYSFINSTHLNNVQLWCL